MSNTGVISMGIKAPIIRQGDDLKQIVIASVMNVLQENGMKIQDGDVIGITESVVARAQGNYVTIDDIVQFLEENKFSKHLVLYSPIMSRNRFSMILKAFARYADKIAMIIPAALDEVGNPTYGTNPFTGVNILSYYGNLCNEEGCEFNHFQDVSEIYLWNEFNRKYDGLDYIDCRCHVDSLNMSEITLADIMVEPVKRSDGTMSGYNADWGLLGSNKANGETLKLFPRKGDAQELVNNIQKYFKDAYGVNIEVLVYGDGCFKNPETDGVSIWEFADPVTCAAFTHGLEGTPNEIKLKAFADDKYKDLKGEELENAIKEEISHKDSNLKGNMYSQGTTPRRYTDLLGSLMDLTSGSGDKGTPFVYVQGYFDNLASE